MQHCASGSCQSYCSCKGQFPGGYTYHCDWSGQTLPLTRVCNQSLESSPYATSVGSCTNFQTDDPSFTAENGQSFAVYQDTAQYPTSACGDYGYLVHGGGTAWATWTLGSCTPGQTNGACGSCGTSTCENLTWVCAGGPCPDAGACLTPCGGTCCAAGEKCCPSPFRGGSPFCLSSGTRCPV